MTTLARMLAAESLARAARWNAPRLVRLHPELDAELDRYAQEHRVKPETVVCEAVRAYLGMAR